jgi:hypothetical protein
VRDRVATLVVVHLCEVMMVALGQGGHGGLERSLGEQVLRCGHVAQYGVRRAVRRISRRRGGLGELRACREAARSEL